MDEADMWVPTLQLTPAFCRICVTVGNVNCHMYEPMNENNETISLHVMLGKLFPAIFNEGQEKNDETMNLPTRICQECKRMVMDAYGLYKQCLTCSDRLTKLLTVEQIVLDDVKEDIELEEENHLLTQDEMTLREEKNKIKRKEKESARRALKTCKAGSKKKRKKSSNKSATEAGALEGKDDSTDVQQCGTTSDDFIIDKSEENEIHSAKADSIDTDPEQMEETIPEIDLYRCQFCDAPTYTSPTKLTDHLKAKHPDQIRCCDQCPKVFMSEPSFQHHQYCHAIGRSHFCILCDKGFQTQTLLQGHIRKHTHRTDYLCFLCGKEFSNSSNLRQHVKRHYGEKPWACDQCPMRFSTKGYLTRHYQTHTKIKKFTCDTCGSHFSRQYTLVKHQLIHTGVRFFSCEVCKMSFTSSDHVKRHMRTHTGEKPYKCGCCGRAFAQSNDMVKHMRTHLGDNAYQCDRCDASYRLLSELRNHYKEHYQPGDKMASSSYAEEEQEIRFTSMNILNRRFDSKPMQDSE